MEERLSATGRRKQAVARVLLRPGRGGRLVNGRDPKSYFGRDELANEIERPFVATGLSGQYDLVATVHGGGITGQAGAIRLGVARALVKADPTHRAALRAGSYLTRDPRAKERKKYGQPAARKRFQFSKR